MVKEWFHYEDKTVLNLHASNNNLKNWELQGKTGKSTITVGM